MTPEQPKISVIVAVYNGAATVQRCIDGFASQTYPNKEMIIVDGGSTDGTVDILKANADKLGFWMSEPDQGISDAWNKALDHASGDWICFQGADDRFWQADALEIMAAHAVKAYPPIRVVYGRRAITLKTGEVLRYQGGPWEEARREMRHTLSIPHTATLHHRTIFEEYGKFDVKLRNAGDYEMLLRELSHGEALFVPGVVVVDFQFGGNSNRPDKAAEFIKEHKIIHARHGIRHRWPNRYSTVTLKISFTALAVRLFGDTTYRNISDGLRRATGHPARWS